MVNLPSDSAPLPINLLNAIEQMPFRIGIASQDLLTENRFYFNPNKVFPQASAIKIPILWQLETEASEGKLSLDERLPIDPTNGAGGCGILQHFCKGGSHLSLADLAMLMITLSDNVATNLLIDRISIAAINKPLIRIGLKETRLRRHMMDFDAQNSGIENTSTPAESLQLMCMLYQLSAKQDPIANKVLKMLRLKKESPLADALPASAIVANKPGMLDGLRTEWAIVNSTSKTGQPINYAVTIMIENKDAAMQRSIVKLRQTMNHLASLIHQHWEHSTN